MPDTITIREALTNVVTFLESLGYKEGGDIHDDLTLAISRLGRLAPRAMDTEL